MTSASLLRGCQAWLGIGQRSGTGQLAATIMRETLLSMPCDSKQTTQAPEYTSAQLVEEALGPRVATQPVL